MILRLVTPVILRGATRAAGELVEVEGDLGRSLIERGLAEPITSPDPPSSPPTLESEKPEAPASDPAPEPPSLPSESEVEEPAAPTKPTAPARKRRRG